VTQRPASTTNGTWPAVNYALRNIAELTTTADVIARSRTA
jgi:hypothetical protein